MFVRLVDEFRAIDQLRYPHRGVVKDNDDPLKLGRVKCLIQGLFPEEADLPDAEEGGSIYDALPWIYPWSSTMLGGRTDSSFFAVPDLESELTVQFPYGNIYAGFYTGYWQTPGTHLGEHNTGYPDSYGFRDVTGTSLLIDKAFKVLEFFHASGVQINMDEEGNITINAPGSLSLLVGQGETGIRIDPTTGEVKFVGSAGPQKVENDIEVDNAIIKETTGSKEESISGSKDVSVGAGHKLKIGGSSSETVVADKAQAIGGDHSVVVGGETSEVNGLGRKIKVPVGDFQIDTLLGGINLFSTLGTIKVPLTGVVEVDGILVQIAGGSQPMLLGQDTTQWLMTHTHPTGVGPSGPPLEAAQAIQLLSIKAFNG